MISPGIRRLALTMTRHCGVQSLFQLRSRGPAVLFYHGVEENLSDPIVQCLHMPLRDFERQIDFLRRNREVISMDHLCESLTFRRRLDPRQVVLTFDDGYANNLRIVAPLLSGWRLPFTIFVSTRHVTEQRRFRTYYIRAAVLYTKHRSVRIGSMSRTFGLASLEDRIAAKCAIVTAVKRAPEPIAARIVRDCLNLLSIEQWTELDAQFSSDEPMSWTDVQRVRSLGATIGSHCHDNCVLHARQRDEEIQYQIGASKLLIEENVAECKYLSYPNGTVRDVSPAAYAAVKEARFQMAFTTIEGEITPEVDCYLAPRICATPDYEEFRYLLSRSAKLSDGYAGACAAVLTGRQSVHAAVGR
jgi:hypothetical protein